MLQWLNLHHSSLLIGALTLLLLQGCSTTSTPTVAQNNNCSFLPISPMPVWVTTHASIPNFYTGIGSIQAEDIEDPLVAVRAKAVGSLSGNISTKVKQIIETTSSRDRETGNNQNRVEQRTSSITQGALRGVQIADKWLDRASCQLWMQVKVSKKVVDHQTKLDNAEYLYQQSKDEAMLKKQQESISEALLTLENVDFSLLMGKDKEPYYQKYRNQQDSLLKQSKGYQTIAITLAPKDLPDYVQKEIVYKFGSGIRQFQHLFPAPCKAKSSCLTYAKEIGSKQLLLVQIQTQLTSGNLGSWNGELSLDAGLLDVESNTTIYQVNQLKGQLLAFSKQQINWGQATERLFANHQETSYLKKMILKCSTQIC